MAHRTSHRRPPPRSPGAGMRSKVEDIPELMQNIQLRLPVIEAARTSVVSKSWLHAWSTIPTLRFDVLREKSMKLVDVDRTLTRYLRDNTPIERFVLMIDIENHESASLAEKWIGPVATKTCLREISLSIFVWGASFKLPDEILASVNLTKVKVRVSNGWTHSVLMTTPVINCVSLRELHLEGRSLCISEEALYGIFSSCRLLEKIVLLGSCKGFKTIKIKNLPRLCILQIGLDAAHATTLEISDVPNLSLFNCDQDLRFSRHAHPPPQFNAYSLSIGSSLTRLQLAGLIADNACLDMFKSEFPFLKSLTLHMTYWKSGSFHLTCASIKSFYLLFCPQNLISVQVHAPKLFFFKFSGDTLPSLLFPVSSLEQITVSLSLNLPVDASFFLKMREAFTLSRNFYLHITTDNSKLPLVIDIDIDDLRTRLLLPPARNAQHLWFETSEDECLWERSPFFDALFEICHPKLVYANKDKQFSHNNHFCRLMLREVLEKKKTNETTTTYWPDYLKHVQIREMHHQEWKTLTNVHRSFLDGSAPDVNLQFKLKWR